ncbi:hypothetical protein TorRG33x02_221600 [Trema orientale]|uniref:Secreted protein n=1 Tax=Trema orientale TaxID=63057 RepID=A0A2P5E925_TREOI|nr:hypothetical protein TorRG33x02_221600 [Trema orientale]
MRAHVGGNRQIGCDLAAVWCLYFSCLASQQGAEASSAGSPVIREADWSVPQVRRDSDSRFLGKRLRGYVREKESTRERGIRLRNLVRFWG